MSAAATIRKNKTAIQAILTGDYTLILNKVYEKELITEREYNNLKSINNANVEQHVVALVDKILSKAEETCQAFLNLLQNDDDVKETFPRLKNVHFLSKSLQASGVLSHDGSSQMETALDVFDEMEKTGLISDTNVNVPHETLQELDGELKKIVQKYMQEVLQQQPQHIFPVHVNSINNQRAPEPQAVLPIIETIPGYRREIVYCDAHLETCSVSFLDQSEYYAMTRNPHGLCVVFNNETFIGYGLKNRRGTRADADALNTVFTRLGFTVEVYNDLTANDMLTEINRISKRNFINEDALVHSQRQRRQKDKIGEEDERLFLEVVCVLTHGEKGCVIGTDGRRVHLQELTLPFRSERVPTLVGKPKLFFIQACQVGSTSPPESTEKIEAFHRGFPLAGVGEDLGRVQSETVPSLADFLLGMATVPECRTFRNTVTGSIYIQELCRQLAKAAESQQMDDILTVLTRVNREVSRGEFCNYKQMPEPKYTLTKKLILKFV